MELLSVHTTYLELSPDTFRPAFLEGDEPLMRDAPVLEAAFARWLYQVVGWAYQWDSRAAWDEAAWTTRLARPEVTFTALFMGDDPSGFFELDAASSEPGTEITHLGLVESYQGRGLGKHLLSLAVTRAFAAGAQRVWLHAIANYQARGFAPYRFTTGQELSYPLGQAPPPTEALPFPPRGIDQASVNRGDPR
ncbi:MAG TPA: GNAT family N-acetyltransferase [Chloroflexota bacterium]|nr:GNAT family N-acetyltransferase [Chloroflexota bacterium]